MKKLICTVGLPRSGKSTWAKEQGYPMVNPDSIRLAIHGKPFIAKAEKLVWATAHYMIDALFLAGHDTVIFDATNMTRKRRDALRDDTWLTHFKVFDTDKDICIARAKKTIPALVPIIERMADNFQPLEEDEVEYMAL